MKRLPAILASFLIIFTNTAQAEYPKAPELQLPTRNGTFQLSDFRGKVIYLDFWASWCKPCKKSFPWLNEIQHQYKDQGLEVVAVNLDEDREKSRKFLQQMPANFLIAYDPEGQSAERFKITGMPSSFLIDRNGYIRERHIGFRVKDIRKKEFAIEKLLNETSQ